MFGSKPISPLPALLSLAMLLPGSALGVSGVSPQGANVNAAGVSTAFLTFQNLAPNERPMDGTWCGDLTVTGPGPAFVTSFDPCVPGTVFGRLPLRNDLSRVSGTGPVRNFTDIMTIPASVARRAYQAAQSGHPGNFFYVRRFSDGVQETYVTITCRLTNGGARVPMALTEVRLQFDTPQGQRPVYFIDRNETLPSFAAEIRYNGAGRLTGRWEIVKPGDPEPASEDLLTEASLPIERRGRQRRYTLIQRFDVFLHPGGSAVLPGPDPRLVAAAAEGRYKILLRVEASWEREGDSDTGSGFVPSGGAAGFPMPVLQFFVGPPEAFASAQVVVTPDKLDLHRPGTGTQVRAGSPVQFSWSTLPGAAAYRLELRGAAATVLNAVVGVGASSYTSPPWALKEPDTELQWRVVAMDDEARSMARSDWRTLRTTTADPAPPQGADAIAAAGGDRERSAAGPR